MTATERLRGLLDARCVKYYKHEDDEPLRKLEKAGEPATSWRLGGASVCAVPIEGSELFDLWIDHCTPEEAVAVTLEERTCEMVKLADYSEYVAYRSGIYVCSRCGKKSVHESSWSYCPNCGAKVVDR